MADGDFVPIPPIHQTGALVVNVFAILSILTFLSVGIRVVYLGSRRLWKSNVPESREYTFFHTQLGNYVACLLIGNLCIGIGGVMGLPWMLMKGITDGFTCRAQALIMQFGSWSTAYFTVAIAVHTINSLVLKKKQSIWISLPTMAFGWILAAVAAAVPIFLEEPEGRVYGPAGLSCGVPDIFPKFSFLFHLLPIFLASFLSACLYSLIYLTLRGTLMIKGGIKLSLDPQGRWNNDMRDYQKFIARVARSMLWYPIAYITLLVPYSIMRLLTISGFTIAWEAMILAFVCWQVLGIANVILLYNTLRVLEPAFDGRSSIISRKTMDSFGNIGYGYYDNDEKSILQAKIDQYRYPTPLYEVPNTRTYDWSFTQPSEKAVLPMYHSRSQSEISASNISLGRSITPVDRMSQMLAIPPPVVQKSPEMKNLVLHVDTSPRSLPAPPRRHSPSPLSISTTSSPAQYYSPSRSPIITKEGIWTPVTPPGIRQTHRISQSWGGRMEPELNRPMLSAVNSSFSSPNGSTRQLLLTPTTSPYNQSRMLPSVPGQRPLMLSRNGSGNSPRPLPSSIPESF